jgi:hypothetical protein
MEGIRVNVPHSPLRCPYCHEDVHHESEPWLACAACLARHHDDCWRDAGRCGTCGATQAAGPVVTHAPSTAPAEEKPRALWKDILAFLFIVAAFLFPPLIFPLLIVILVYRWIRGRR